MTPSIRDDLEEPRVLADHGSTLVYRARRRAQAGRGMAGSVLVKTGGTQPTSAKVARALSVELRNAEAHRLACVVAAQELVHDGGDYLLLSEDFGGEPLSSWMVGGPRPLPEVLAVCSAITRALASLHEASVLDPYLRPSTVYLDARTMTAKLALAPDPGNVDGAPMETLHFLAPERTGRVRHAVTASSDLYSLGAIFYALATGRPPFAGTDARTLVHAHIAQIPAPANAVRPEVPSDLAAVIGKLLAKDPDERYASALGVLADLEDCAKRWRGGATSTVFELGRRERELCFRVPDKLYGRSSELAAVREAFERVDAGATGVVWISGPPGIGKTRLVEALHAELAARDVYFVASKFDQVRRGVPYSAVFDALACLVQRILAERDERLAALRSAIRTSLGVNARVLVEVLPELVHLTGECPAVPELPPADARRRFWSTVRRFFAAFAAAGVTVVLVLDDLQWADAASLELLEHCLHPSETGRVLLIAGCRDEEGFRPHLAVLDALVGAGLAVHRIPLGPLSSDAVDQMLVDTLATTRQQAEPLARALLERSGGSPFFVRQLLASLQAEGALWYARAERRWRWDPERIAVIATGGDVVSLIAAKIRGLAPEVREALAVAALMGNEIGRRDLATVLDRDEDRVGVLLATAVAAGLLVRRHAGELCEAGTEASAVHTFAHDRVQQAVDDMLDADTRTRLHLRIARCLLEHAPERIYQIVSHYGAAAELLDDSERMRVAALDLAASARALEALAPAEALALAETGLGMIHGRVADDELVAGLRLQTAIAQHHLGRFREAEAGYEWLLARKFDPSERGQLVRRLGQLYMDTHAYARAFERVVQMLAELGLRPPVRSDPASAAEQETRLLDDLRQLARTQAGSLAKRPLTADPMVVLESELLAQALPAAFHESDGLGYIWSVHELARLCVEHGNMRSSPYAYISVAGVLVTAGEYELGMRMIDVAIEAAEYVNDSSSTSKVNCVAAIVSAWGGAIARTDALSRRGFSLALDCAEHHYSLYGGIFYIYNRWLSAFPLDELAHAAADTHRALREASGKTSFAVAMLEHAARLLTAQTGEFPADDPFGFEALARSMPEADSIQREIACTTAATVAYLLDAPRDTIAWLDRAETIVVRPPLLFVWVEVRFLGGLASAALADRSSGEERATFVRQLDLATRELATALARGASGLAGYVDLLAAERSRLAGDTRSALVSYDRAQVAFHERGTLQWEAVALTLGSRVLASTGLAGAAARNDKLAADLLRRWGATALLGERSRAEQTVEFEQLSQSLDLRAIVQASQMLSGELVLEQLVRRFLEIAIPSSGARKGLFLTVEGGELVVRARADASASVVPMRQPVGQCPELPTSVLAYVRRAQQPVVLDDASSSGPFVHSEYVQQRGTKSLLCLPLMRQRELEGVLYLDSDVLRGAFTPDRVELVKALAAQVVISMENAALYADLEQRVEERTRELRAAQARLVAVERQATENLMAGGFAHETRNALAGAKTVAQALCTAMDGEASLFEEDARDLDLVAAAMGELRPEIAEPIERIRGRRERLVEGLEIIGESVQRSLEITNTLLEYARAGQLAAESGIVDVSKELHSLANEFAMPTAREGISFEVDIEPGLAMRGTRSHLFSIVQNLLLNAREAMRDAASVRRRIELSAHRYGDVLSIEVDDTGPGMTDAVKRRVFEPFFSTKPGSGTGLGLALVRKLVELYAGTIEIESTPGAGCRFRVQLPACTDES